MKIQESKAQVPRKLPIWRVEEPKTAAELERGQCLGSCPGDLTDFATGVCALVYHPLKEIARRLRDVEVRDVEFFNHRGSQAVGFEYGGRTWLVFRGTEAFPETEMFLDWGHDLMCLPVGSPPRHLGFVRAWQKLRQPVLEWISTREKGQPLVLSGHSLGGALALLAANDIAFERRARIDAVITFGAPRVGTRRWVARYHHLSTDGLEPSPSQRSLRDVTFRIHHTGDIVTYVPPLIFTHCGQPISATSLQAVGCRVGSFPVSLMGAVVEEVPGPGLLGRFRYGYRTARRTLPYSPLNLLLDLFFAFTETAPKHFMRHYAPAFPDRPFHDLNEPRMLPGRDLCNSLLFGVKCLIVSLLALSLLAAAILLYRLSPDLSLVLLLGSILYALFPTIYARV